MPCWLNSSPKVHRLVRPRPRIKRPVHRFIILRHIRRIIPVKYPVPNISPSALGLPGQRGIAQILRHPRHRPQPHAPPRQPRRETISSRHSSTSSIHPPLIPATPATRATLNVPRSPGHAGEIVSPPGCASRSSTSRSFRSTVGIVHCPLISPPTGRICSNGFNLIASRRLANHQMSPLVNPLQERLQRRRMRSRSQKIRIRVHPHDRIHRLISDHIPRQIPRGNRHRFHILQHTFLLREIRNLRLVCSIRHKQNQPRPPRPDPPADASGPRS